MMCDCTWFLNVFAAGASLEFDFAFLCTDIYLYFFWDLFLKQIYPCYLSNIYFWLGVCVWRDLKMIGQYPSYHLMDLLILWPIDSALRFGHGCWTCSFLFFLCLSIFGREELNVYSVMQMYKEWGCKVLNKMSFEPATWSEKSSTSSTFLSPHLPTILQKLFVFLKLSFNHTFS